MRLKIPAGAAKVATFGAWSLYLLPARPGDSFLWLKVKLMLPPTVRAKWGAARAYRLSWHCAEQRFAHERRLMDLQEKHPELYAEVLAYLSREHGPDSLGATAEAIAVEIARLRSLKARF